MWKQASECSINCVYPNLIDISFLTIHKNGKRHRHSLRPIARRFTIREAIPHVLCAEWRWKELGLAEGPRQCFNYHFEQDQKPSRVCQTISTRYALHSIFSAISREWDDDDAINSLMTIMHKIQPIVFRLKKKIWKTTTDVGLQWPIVALIFLLLV